MKHILINILWLIIGSILIVFSFLEKLDSFWNGMGSALCVVGIINLLRSYRLNKNQAYREKVEIELSDERNRFIRNKAWAYAGYIFTIITSIASIILKIIGQDLLSIVAGFSTLLLIVIFWISYLYLREKY